MQKRIYASLIYKKKCRGRCLKQDMVSLGLKRGNRLEPSEEMPDVGMFETMTVPFLALFWIWGKDARILHTNPLLLIPGFTLDKWAIDLLHTWHLGPIQAFVALVLFMLLASGLWTPTSRYLDQKDKDQLSLLNIKSELYGWYKTMGKDPKWKKSGTEIWNLTLGMIGSKSKPMLHAKAKESEGMLKFTIHMLSTHQEALSEVSPETKMQTSLLLEAGKAALDIDSVLHSTSSRHMSHDQCEGCFYKYLRFAVLFQRAGGTTTPKSHLMIHLFQRAVSKGNPRFYHTYRDESLNKMLANVARSAHRLSWQETVFKKLKLVSRENVKALCEKLMIRIP